MLGEIEKASSDELIALAVKLERMVAFKRHIDTIASEEGSGMVLLTGRELELILDAVEHSMARAFLDGR